MDEMKETSLGTGRLARCAALCTIFPFSLHEMGESEKSPSVSIHGPHGRRLSKDFRARPLSVFFCSRCAVTSFRQVQPKMNRLQKRQEHPCIFPDYYRELRL